MEILLLIFLFMAESATGECIVEELSDGESNYSMVYSCTLNYTAAYDQCLSGDMQLLFIKTREELNFISDNIIRLQYNNSMFWIGGVCPEVLDLPDKEDLCPQMSSNVSSEVTTSYFRLISKCETPNAWICENSNVGNPCPTMTSSTTSTTTTTPTTATSISTTSTTTRTTPTPSSTSTSTSTKSTSTSTTTTTSTISSKTTKETRQDCTNGDSVTQGSNQYLLFHNCSEDSQAASSVCSKLNSSLAVLVSQTEIMYLADQTAGQSNGSWTYWVGGLTETGSCVMFTFDQSVMANTSIRYGITTGRGCGENHPFICKTFVETFQEKRKRHQSNLTQGSVMDHRPSAIFLGSFGIAILVMIFVVVLIIDLPNIIHDLKRAREGLGLNKKKHIVISKTDLKSKHSVETKKESYKQ